MKKREVTSCSISSPGSNGGRNLSPLKRAALDGASNVATALGRGARLARSSARVLILLVVVFVGRTRRSYSS